MDEVILVDADDRPVGVTGKQAAHARGQLHRAFSIIVHDSAGRMLLQQRAGAKYHSGGLWSNTCCSHPRPGEDTEAAAHRRLMEEMGFDCALYKAHQFVYRVELDNELIEHEFDHVFIGRCEARPRHNREEVEAWRWVDPRELAREAAQRPQLFTYWFRQCLAEMPSLLQGHGAGGSAFDKPGGGGHTSGQAPASVHFKDLAQARGSRVSILGTRDACAIHVKSGAR